MSLTTKEEIFVQRLVEKCSQREAYKFAYECGNMKDHTIDRRACELFAKPKIKARYDELMQEIKQQCFYTVEKANNDLEWIKAKAKEDIEYKGLKQANSGAFLNAIKQQVDLNGITIKEAKQDLDNVIKFEIVGAKNGD